MQNPNTPASDLSYQVMPQSPQSSGSGNIPSTPPPQQPPSGGLPSEPESSWFHSRLLYIVLGAVVLAALGVTAYFLLGSNKQELPPETKLPKTWLNEFFNVE